jgi:hypothetical protein
VHCNSLLFVRDKLVDYDLRKAGFLSKDKGWQHEHASEMMFDDMMNQYDLDFPPKDVMFIKALIAGDRNRCRSVIRFPHMIHLLLILIFRKR